MKLYCYYTPSYRILIDDWFVPSVRSEYELVLKCADYQGISVDFKEPGWFDIVGEKIDFLIQAVGDNIGKVFVFSDPDIQFFGQTKDDILSVMKGFDLLFHCDSPDGVACTGFIVCLASEKTLKLWQDVRAGIGMENKDDQDAVNKVLINNACGIPYLILRKFVSSPKLAPAVSSLGMNPYRIKWRLLPTRYFGGGTLTARLWNPGCQLPVPKDIVLHHANWTVGLENKLAQLEYVKGLVRSRQGNVNKN